MHCFKYRGIGPDVSAGGHPEASDQSRDQVRENIAEQVRGHQHIELPGVQNQLHGASIDDDRLQYKFALVLAFVQIQSRLEKNSRERLHDVGFVHDGDFLAAGRYGVCKREFQQAPATLACVYSGGHGQCMRIIVDLDVHLVADVQTLEILPHHHQIDVVETAARDQCAGGPQIRI